MRYFGGAILVIASLYYMFKELIGLYRCKKFKNIIGHLIFIITYPAILFFTVEYIRNLEITFDIKIIISIPVLIFMPVWLMYGFFVNKNLENAIETSKKI